MAGLLPYALHHRLLTLILGLGLVALGLWSFQQLKLEAYPDISDTGVVVITVYPGNASEEVEQQVTIPIERALNNVPHVIAPAVPHDLRALRRRADLCRRHRRLLRPATRPREAARRRAARRRHADAGAAFDRHQRVLPLCHRGRRARRYGAARAPGLDHRAPAGTSRGRRGRGHLRRRWSSSIRSKSTRSRSRSTN